MSFYRLKSLVKMFLLFCLVAMMAQQTLLLNLNMNVKGEETSINYRSIDLYTQKEPYSGRGPNRPSDSFAPQEEVILYAYVTYRDYPVAGKPVAFEVCSPKGDYKIWQSAETNANGIANVSFRIPSPNDYPKEAIFGVWNVIATVDVAQVIVNDTLSFLVGWIIELIKVETVDLNNVSRTSFMRNEHVCFRLTVRNIAMTDKIATLTIDIYDNKSFPSGHIGLVDEQIAANTTTVLFIEDFLIPVWVSLGDSVVYANAYTMLPALGGVPWCPQVSTTFSIVKMIVRDVAVINVTPSATEAFSCQIVDVSVVVRNEGDVCETFNVSSYYDSVLIGTLTIENLPPKTESILKFSWPTCSVPPGNYTLSAVASTVPGEVDVKDNRFIDGIVQIKPLIPPPPVEYVFPKWLLVLLFILALLIGACLVAAVIFAMLWRRKRKKKDKIIRQPTPPEIKPFKEVEFKRSKKCSACGKEFSGVYTFCPYCFTFHGKDYK